MSSACARCSIASVRSPTPPGATHQLLGAYDDAIRPVLAGALAELGTTRSWVVRSEDGLDEMSPFAATRISEVEAGTVREFSLTPEDFGLERSAPGAIAGADPVHNARVLEAILRNEAHPARDAILLNAAAALVVALKLDPKAATERAREALKSGAAIEQLLRLRRAAESRRAEPTSPATTSPATTSPATTSPATTSPATTSPAR